jgi:hypothetical protein
MTSCACRLKDYQQTAVFEQSWLTASEETWRPAGFLIHSENINS